MASSPQLSDSSHVLLAKIAECVCEEGGLGSGVTSFNGQTGVVTLSLADVSAVGDARYVQKTGDEMSGSLRVSPVHQDVSGLLASVLIDPVISPPAGVANFQALALDYVVNASGAQAGSVTGFSFRATETALNGFSHNLITAVVNGDTKFRLMSNGNFGIGSFVGAANFAPGSAGTFLVINSTPPTGDPAANAFQFWSDSGQFAYRTPVASEGGGQTNRVHNRAAQATGAGTNYTLTGATARVDFGTVDAEVVLPTAGTYFVTATVSFIGDAAGAGDVLRAKLRNITDSADIGSEKAVSAALSSSREIIVLTEVVAVAASKTVQVFAHNATLARGTVESTTTSLSFVRLF